MVNIAANRQPKRAMFQLNLLSIAPTSPSTGAIIRSPLLAAVRTRLAFPLTLPMQQMLQAVVATFTQPL
jgi:hypothetical protein